MSSKIIYSFYALTIFLLCNALIKSQPIANESNSEGLNKSLNSLANTFTSPLQWEGKDLLTFAILSASWYAAYINDTQFRKPFTRSRNSTFDQLEPIGYLYGSPFVMAPVSLLTFGIGEITGNDKVSKTGLLMSELVLSVGIIQMPASIIIGRARPSSGFSKDVFEFGNGAEHNYASFISGHTAIAVGVSRILSHQLNNTYASIALYGLAAITTLSRLYEDKHWTSDILLGAAIGYFVSGTILEFHYGKKTKNKLAISPHANGIQVSYSF